MSRLEARRLGRIDHADATALQEKLVEDRHHDLIPDQLLLCEHEGVFTVGRATKADSLPRDPGAKIIETSRGGDVTWHGPGQIVGYWIRKLEGEERDLHAHLRTIESHLIDTLGEFGVTADRRDGLTGVWTGNGKIASIGVATRRWVTWHGFALNLDVPAETYDRFRPCGLDGAVMCDLASHLDSTPDRAAVEAALCRQFGAITG